MSRLFVTFNFQIIELMQITISGKAILLNKVMNYAEKLGLKVKNQNPKSSELKAEIPNGKLLYEVIQKNLKKGGITSIKDPAAWQREIRNDRTLIGRD